MWYPDHLSTEYAEAALASKLVKLKRSGGQAYAGRLDLHSYDSHPEEHWRQSAPAEKVVVFGLQARKSGIWVPNDVIVDYVRQHPEKLEGWASIDPTEPGHIEEMERCRFDLGMKGLKLGPIYQHFDLTDQAVWPVYERAQAWGWPIMWHMGTTFPRNAPLKYTLPILLEDVALAFPDLRMIIAHMGHPWEVETVVLIRKQPNVYADISALHYRPWRYWQALVTAMEYGVEHKLLFGSDFPSGTVENVIAGLRGVNRLVEGTQLPKVPDDVVEMIIHENWKTFFPHWSVLV
jgi:predicted TIM-barrel fold metal-dependent hydrolase